MNEDNIIQIKKQLEEYIKCRPKVAIILGSGLSDFTKEISNKIEIPYSRINGFPQVTVKGHDGKFICGDIEGVQIICMSGRFHLYEGYTSQEACIPIYVFKALGVEALIITNAAGAVNQSFRAGDLMLVNDHINFTGQNPLIGKMIIDYGERFIDLSTVYDIEYMKKINEIAIDNNIKLAKGTYMQLLGPSYETTAEVKMARALGADAVGMSTVIEVIAAAQNNLRVACISVIANMAVGMNDGQLSHDEVVSVIKKNSNKLEKLIYEFILSLNANK